MTDTTMDTTAADNALRADRAERILEGLRARDPVEADVQASAMVMAGLKLLQEVRGTPSVLDTLSRLGPVLAAECPVEPQPAPVIAPQPLPHADLVGQALAHLRGLPVDHALAQANAAMTAAGRFITETVRGGAPIAPPRPAVVPAEQLACALVEQLRTMHRGEAHERARATVVGAAAYLHETFGRSYAGALLDGTLQAAAAHGDKMRGGRDTLDTLH